MLYELYGRRADRVVYSYTSATRFEHGRDAGGTLHLHVVMDEAPEPVFDADCDIWLRLAFCEGHEKVLDWLATLPRLGEPTGALLLLGEHGVGKSMIASAIGRYFGCSLADYDDIFKGRFNDALLRSPVIHLDEKTEVDAKSAGFRKFLANYLHAIEAKHKPSTTLHGCPRMIVTSNNPDPLRLGRERHTAADERAIGVRCIVVRCNAAAAGWLAKRGGKRGITRDWIRRPDGSHGRLVQHIAWLVTNRRVEEGPRFLVEGDAEGWVATAGTRTGTPADILDAFRNWSELTGQERHRLFGDRSPFLYHPDHPGHFCVSAERIRSGWQRLLGRTEAVPSHRNMAEALQILSGQDKSTKLTFSSDRIRVYIISEARVD